MLSVDEQKLLEHRRRGHFALKNLKVQCPECSLAKGRNPSVKKSRPPHTRPDGFNILVAWDFKGPLNPESHAGNKILLNAVCEGTGWCESYPCVNKSEAPKRLTRWCKEFGPPGRIRSDNAPEFKGSLSQWRQTAEAQTPPIKVEHSVVYFPNTNGVVERFNGTLSEALKANLAACDPKLWDHCAIYLAHTWNRMPRTSRQVSPFEKRFGRKPSTGYFKRFGCLAYAKIHTQQTALEPKYERGVFLGYPPAGCYKVGVWRDDARCASGERFEVIENRAVKFEEAIPIPDIDVLKKLNQGTYVKFTPPSMLCETVAELDELVVAEGGRDPSVCAPLGGPRSDP
eukprot:gene365-366_t